ncbi:FAM92 protein [Catenaria anguillulae PL171]|uniref:FAM92 protein n=1 Tax=Catenaria anguillulae PL171 TaxID=765915 RepID=A0A1Y2H795_9FUNG|nr:FAM92 protein [Catenaria anguillulae PL171]
MLSPRSVTGVDETSRFVRTLVNDSESNLFNLRNGFSSVLRAHERMRAKGQKLANVMKVFAERETPGVKACLVAAAETVTEVEKLRKEMQDRVNLKCREPLGMYASICDGVLDDLKVREVAIRKEQEKQLQLDRIQVRESGNRTKINQGHIELSGASHEATTSSLALTDTVERFELKKVTDIKSCMQEFVYSQMQFHAKSLEIYTDLMALINSTDFDADVDDVCDRIRPQAPKEGLAGNGSASRRPTMTAQR